MKKPVVVVIGGGHAGVEAAVAAVTVGAEVILVTPSIKKIALMSCNPSIGGIAKGTLVREIDGLGGVTGRSADKTAIQFRMLNMKKGPAVWGPRVQTDVWEYCEEQRKRLEEAGVKIVEGVVEEFSGPNEKISGVVLHTGTVIHGNCFVLAAGTFLRGVLHRGEVSWPGGRRGDISADRLETHLRERMFHVKRFKTGTSPRLVRSSINTDILQEQSVSEMNFRFSWSSEQPVRNREKCWVTRTTGKTEKIVRESLSRSPLYSGRITGKGPRYCPSFEDKVTKFPERTGHPIHLEPMGIGSRIMYLNGLSTSLPEEIQDKMVKSLPGFDNAVIAAYGYSVEYSSFETGQFSRALRLKGTENLYAAGQILGTSGYEEAAAAGLLAGANAARTALGLGEVEPDRMDSYLGVMVDDLVYKGADEPYRLFSSRAENRLHLRQDNADRRVHKLGTALGTLSEKAQRQIQERASIYGDILKVMRKTRVKGETVENLAKRPEVTAEIAAGFLGITSDEKLELLRSAVLDAKYSGYINRADRRHRARGRYMEVPLEGIADFTRVATLSIEAAQVLNDRRPETIGEADKISGVRQSDIDALVLYLMKGDVSRETS